MYSKIFTAFAVAAATFTATTSAFADWRDQIPVVRVGIIGGENEADRLKRLSCLEVKIKEKVELPVQFFPATDYAGVMQGLLAGQLEMAGLGPVGYAGIMLQDENAVEPFVVSSNVDGSLGYYSVIITRADSGITDLEGLKGKSLAWADPNSSSGYLYPKAGLELADIKIDEYFSSTGFSGGHEQSVLAVLDKQYDSAATWSSMMGEKAEGYTRGNIRRMVDKGMLKMDDINIVWQSGLIPNGPTVIRKDLPAEFKAAMLDLYTNLHVSDPECYKAVMGGEGAGYVVPPVGFYDETIELRRREVAGSR
ncbi:phosphate/phosphite/phosphonate ABC transporter substrate-binding protein [Pannonibacter carbonis]|uniref:phosphate/phosphite/phosphonate ABC transporter substrate-binding protein n=1 Tax=Pannonibacter carbonis TaxID=2067569 RepID=UPI00130056D2|nr:phosphate/phosphite/phosphonate ABC transporter substrate-binding protein [Pannonibacter carbonis]